MTDPRHYPTTPRYGQQAPRGNPFLGGAPFGSQPAPSDSRSAGSWLPVALSLVFNLVTLAGVLAFGWPPGNVFLLFWAENVVLGIWTLAKVASAQGQAGPITVNGRPVDGTPFRYALFFTAHYGIFCVVHLVFTALVAYRIGLQLSFLSLGLPVVLLLIRYTVETCTTWFGPDGLRRTTSPSRAMMQPYPRVIVLHLAVLLGFFLVVTGSAGPESVSRFAELLRPVLVTLPAAWRSPGVLLVIVLIGLKTVVDVFTTRRAVRG